MTKVFFAHLRRPRNRKDRRADPFYESGSFGCTECHSTNLLHPRNATKLKGAQLAFVQGGKLGSRLVFLTPPITVVKRWMKYEDRKWSRICEVKWKPADMPFKYADAPLLVSNDGRSDFPSVKDFARRANRPTFVSRLSSLIRTRESALDENMAKEVVAKYKQRRRKAIASHSGIASTYDESISPRKSGSVLPSPGTIDRNRRKRIAAYRSEIKELVPDNVGADGVLQVAMLPRTTARSCCGKLRPRRAARRARRC